MVGIISLAGNINCLKLFSFLNSRQNFFVSKGSTKLEKAEILQLTVEHLRGLKYGGEYTRGKGSLSNDIEKNFKSSTSFYLTNIARNK